MVKIRTLNTLEDLSSSAFNQPPPRHGLNLLYWFASAKDQLDPTRNTYGFHRFHNRIDDDDEKLLPNSENILYYEVGNLKEEGADRLPSYVRPTNQYYHGENNKDRIIVGLFQGRIKNVYVTEHENPKDFSHEHTYRVSQGLLDQIRNMNKEQFLNRMKQNQIHITNQSGYTSNTQQQSSNDGSWCTIL